MTSLTAWRNGFERLMEYIVIALMIILALIVTVGIAFRYSGHPLPWYDEVASVLLAWLTYYGAGLAALKRAHIGVPTLVRAMPPALRLPVVVFSECCVFGFLILLAWLGWHILYLLQGETLVTVNIPVTVTQSAVPIGALLYVIAEALNLPDVLREARYRNIPDIVSQTPKLTPR